MSDPREQFVNAVAKHLRAGERFAAAKLIREFVGRPKEVSFVKSWPRREKRRT